MYDALLPKSHALIEFDTHKKLYIILDVILQSETLDPLLAACAESPARGNGRRPPASPLHPDACAEMRRQILYLQVTPSPANQT